MIYKQVSAKFEDLKYENVASVMRRYTFYETSSRVEQEDTVTR
jgi:hypothetical protein